MSKKKKKKDDDVIKEEFEKFDYMKTVKNNTSNCSVWSIFLFLVDGWLIKNSLILTNLISRGDT